LGFPGLPSNKGCFVNGGISSKEHIIQERRRALKGKTFGKTEFDRNGITLHPALIKKENIIFIIYQEIQKGAVAKSDLTKGLLIYD
jgi:hypothetical protein